MILSAEELAKILATVRSEMREIAREEANNIMSEHLDDCEHKEKKAQVELCEIERD